MLRLLGRIDHKFTDDKIMNFCFVPVSCDEFILHNTEITTINWNDGYRIPFDEIIQRKAGRSKKIHVYIM